MTKRELLEKICEKKGAETEELCKARLDNVCDVVRMMPENEILKEAPEIERYLNESESHLDGDILETIINKLRAWVKRQEQKNVVQIVGNEWLCEQCGKTHITSAFFIVVFALLAVAVFVFSILDNLEVFTTRGLASGICGSIDFLCGVGFFIYEWISDKKVKTMYDYMRDITGIVYYKSKFNVKGNGNNFGVMNQGASCDIEERAKNFIVKYSKNKVKVKGDENNLGIRN